MAFQFIFAVSTFFRFHYGKNFVGILEILADDPIHKFAFRNLDFAQYIAFRNGEFCSINFEFHSYTLRIVFLPKLPSSLDQTTWLEVKANSYLLPSPHMQLRFWRHHEALKVFGGQFATYDFLAALLATIWGFL